MSRISNLPGNSGYNGVGVCRVDHVRGERRSRDMKQSDLCNFDWSTVDLCAVENQKTCLCEAIGANDEELLRVLLQCIKDDPLKYPCEKVIYLIAGCGQKIKGIKMPLLMRAVTSVHSDNLHIVLRILNLLFDTLRYYDLNACEDFFSLKFTREQYTVIHEAVERFDPEILEYLMSKYIEIKVAQGLPYHSALQSLRKILNIANNINSTPLDLVFYMRPLNCAISLAMSNSLAMSESLPQCGDALSQMMFGYKSDLYGLIKSGNTDRFISTIEEIRKKCKESNSCQDQETVDTVVNLVDEDGRTLLHYAVLCEAAKRCHPGGVDGPSSFVAVKYLMKLGASCTRFDKKKISPLFLAIAFGHLDLVQLLLDNEFPGNLSLQSSINHQGINGLTPLNLSVWSRVKTIIPIVLGYRKKFVQYNRTLHASDAIGKVNLKIVGALLNAGADPLISDDAGETPLHKAAKTLMPPLVSLLLEFGADPLARDSKGCSPLTIILEQLPINPSRAHCDVAIMRILADMVDCLIREKQFLGVRPYTYKSIELFIHFKTVYKDAAYTDRQDLWKKLLEPYLHEEVFRAIIESIPKSTDKKRPRDADFEFMYPSTKRRQQTVKQCDLSSGRSQAT